MLITRKSASLIRTPPPLKIFHPTTIPLRATRRALPVVAARILAVAEIVAVTVVAIAAATVVVADVGAAVADASAAAAAGALRVPAVAISLLPNMLRRKAASLAGTILVVTTTVGRTTAAREVRKIVAVRRVVSNRAVRRSVVLIIARLKLPVPPHQALSRKNPFCFPASRLPNTVESPLLLLRLQLPSRKLTSRNQISKTQHLALPAT
jgi:hypothetical protein